MKFRPSMRNYLLLIGALTAMFAFAGCGNDDDPTRNSDEPQKQRSAQDIVTEKKNFSEEPPPVQILTGDETGYRVSKPTAVVAHTKAEENAMLKKQFSRGVKKEFIADSDFKTRQVVGLFMPAQSPGTHMVITDIHEENGKIQIKAILLENGKGCKTTGDKTRPFHIVETRQMKGTPEVKIVSQKASPC